MAAEADHNVINEEQCGANSVALGGSTTNLLLDHLHGDSCLGNLDERFDAQKCRIPTEAQVTAFKSRVRVVVD